jgi:hypothetical protein
MFFDFYWNYTWSNACNDKYDIWGKIGVKANIRIKKNRSLLMLVPCSFLLDIHFPRQLNSYV